jgi:hypothetical protein
MLFNPLKVFVPPALACLTLGGLKLVLDLVFAVIRAGGLTWRIFLMPAISTSALVLILAGIQMLLIGMLSDAVARKMGRPVGPGLASPAPGSGSRQAADRSGWTPEA